MWMGLVLATVPPLVSWQLLEVPGPLGRPATLLVVEERLPQEEALGAEEKARWRSFQQGLEGPASQQKKLSSGLLKEYLLFLTPPRTMAVTRAWLKEGDQVLVESVKVVDGERGLQLWGLHSPPDGGKLLLAFGLGGADPGELHAAFQALFSAKTPAEKEAAERELHRILSSKSRRCFPSLVAVQGRWTLLPCQAPRESLAQELAAFWGELPPGAQGPFAWFLQVAGSGITSLKEMLAQGGDPSELGLPLWLRMGFPFEFKFLKVEAPLSKFRLLAPKELKEQYCLGLPEDPAVGNFLGKSKLTPANLEKDFSRWLRELL